MLMVMGSLPTVLGKSIELVQLVVTTNYHYLEAPNERYEILI